MIGFRSRAALMLAAGMTALSGCAEKAETAPAATAANAAIGGDERNGDYLPAIDWMKLDPKSSQKKGDVEWGDISSVSAIDPNRVFVVTWGDKNAKGEIQNPNNPTHMVVVLDKDGNVIENWSQWDS